LKSIRRDVLTPSPLHGLVRFLIKGDKKFNHGLQASIDYLVSAFMIVTLLVTVLFATILLIIQVFFIYKFFYKISYWIFLYLDSS